MDDGSRSSTIKIGELAVTHVSPAQKSEDLPIVFVHGAWGGKWQFENWQRYAAERGFGSYALDVRGHGESPCEHFEHASIEDYVDDVLAVIGRIGPCYLVGHSMGGLVSQLASTRTKNVQKLVLVASAPRRTLFVNAYILRMLTYVVAALRSGVAVPKRKDIERFFGAIPPEAIPRFTPESGRASRELVLAVLRRPTIPCPVFVAAGEKDALLPLWTEKKLARMFNAEFASFPTGHFLMLEPAWAAPIERILEWLKK